MIDPLLPAGAMPNCRAGNSAGCVPSAFQVFLGALAQDHLPKLGAYMRHQLQELLGRLSHIERKELQNSQNFLFHQYRKSKRGAEPRQPGRSRSTAKVRSFLDLCRAATLGNRST